MPEVPGQGSPFSGGRPPRKPPLLPKVTKQKWKKILVGGGRLESYAHTSPWNLLGLGLIGIVFYVASYFAIGKTFLPGGKMWSLVVLWLCAHIGGFLVTLVGLHSLLGMLFAGIILRNIPVTWLISGLPASWSGQIRQAALGLIFLRSGMELDIKALKVIGPLAVRLLVIPTLWEAIVSGTVAHPVFGMPYLLGYALGFILTAVGPAIVIQLMFDLQKEGYGVKRGIPATVVAAASFDDILAITFYTIFINLAIPGTGNSALHIAMGPLNIVLGALMGPIGALICCPTKLWDTTFKRTAVLTLTTLLFKWLLSSYGFSDAGTLGALSLGIITNQMWARGWPAAVSAGPDPAFAAEAERYMGLFWKWVAQPLLFGAIGSGLNFLNGSVKPGVIPRSLGVIASGWVTRFPITMLMAWGGERSLKEKLFLGVAWLPKATVQAALAGEPLAVIHARGLNEEWQEWGQEIQTTAIFSIIFCATVGILLIHYLGPICLDKAPLLVVRAMSGSVREIVSPDTGEVFDTQHASKGRIVIATTSMIRSSKEYGHSHTPQSRPHSAGHSSFDMSTPVPPPPKQRVNLTRITSETAEGHGALPPFPPDAVHNGRDTPTGGDTALAPHDRRGGHGGPHGTPDDEDDGHEGCTGRDARRGTHDEDGHEVRREGHRGDRGDPSLRSAGGTGDVADSTRGGTSPGAVSGSGNDVSGGSGNDVSGSRGSGAMFIPPSRGGGGSDGQRGLTSLPKTASGRAVAGGDGGHGGGGVMGVRTLGRIFDRGENKRRAELEKDGSDEPHEVLGSKRPAPLPSPFAQPD